MGQMILFILATIGLTHILVDGKVFLWFRNLADKYFPKFLSELLHCYTCAGFWCGMITGYIVFLPENLWLLLPMGWASSFVATLAAIYLNYLEAKTIINLPEK